MSMGSRFLALAVVIILALAWEIHTRNVEINTLLRERAAILNICEKDE